MALSSLSSNKFSDANLRNEIISVLLGEPITNYDKRRGKTANVLSVDDFHKRTILGKVQASAKGLFIDQAEFFDPEYDFDFTDLSTADDCKRGGEPYRRPCGWYRIALKVKSKYPDGDAWLGTGGWRSHSVPGEWPVCFHGTSLDGAKGIIEGHFQAGPRALYGRGIYSTPDIKIAKWFATTFTSQTTGKNYMVILQNRINPAEREFCSEKDYWLIPVPAGTSADKEKEIVERSIRPYGILIKEVHDEMDSQIATEECANDEDDDDDDDAAEDEDDQNAEEDDDSGAGASALTQMFNWVLNLF